MSISPELVAEIRRNEIAIDIILLNSKDSDGKKFSIPLSPKEVSKKAQEVLVRKYKSAGWGKAYFDTEGKTFNLEA